MVVTKSKPISLIQLNKNYLENYRLCFLDILAVRNTSHSQNVYQVIMKKVELYYNLAKKVNVVRIRIVYCPARGTI